MKEEEKTVVTTEELVKKIHQLEARVKKLEARHNLKSTPNELMERWEKLKEESLAYSGKERLGFLYKVLDQFTPDEIGEIARSLPPDM